MKKLKDTRLLVLSPRYPHIKDPVSSSFVKNQIEFLKGYVERVYVISLAPLVPKFLSHFSFMDSKGRWDGYAQDYRYDNVEVYFAKPLALPFGFSRKKRGDDSLKSALKVIRDNGIEFDLIHAHFTYPAGYVGAKLKELSGKRLVLTVHENRDFFLNEISSGDSKLLYTWQSADEIIRVNRGDLTEFERIDIDHSKLVYLPNGFSPKLFRPIDQIEARKKLGLPLDKRILLNLAGLEVYKGQEYLIRAMNIIVEARDDVVLYIVGKGSLMKHLQSLIRECGLLDHVILAGGNKPAEELSLWMNSCDLFVLPSLSESFGIVQIEAMACCKPVVATYNGGSEEVIVDDKLGILVRPRDVEGLAEAIAEALSKSWDENYIFRYAEQFAWDAIAERVAAIYRSML